jgi:virginiamycin B lyase
MAQIKRGAVLIPVLITLALPAAVTAAPPRNAASTVGDHRAVTEFPTADGTAPFGVTAGPRGEYVSLNSSIGRFDHRGNLTTIPIPSDHAGAGWLTTDRSGAIWISERNAGKIGRLSPNGSLVEFQLPSSSTTAGPQGSVVTPGGTLYVTDQANNTIVRLDPRTGQTTSFPVPTLDATPLGLTLGSDGALWFIERSADQIGRMTLDGAFREWSLTPGSFPNRIVTASDGAVWFTELFGGKIGRMSMNGTLTEYPIDGGPVGITVGRDGQLYVVLFLGKQVARVNLHGTVTGTWDLPGAVTPLLIATGRGQDLWVTDYSANAVFRVSVVH